MCVYVFIKCGNYSLMLIIFFPMHEFKDILGRQKTHKKLKTSLGRHERDFFFVLIRKYFVPPPRSYFFSSFFVVFKERERTRGCLSKRVKNISRRSNTASRAFIHLKLPPRVRTAVFGRLFFSGRQRLIICCCRGLRKNCRR